MEYQQAAQRSCHRLHTGQRRCRVAQGGQGGRFAVDGAVTGQVIEDCRTVLFGQRMADIALATQLDGHREAALGDRELLAEALLQLPPDQGEAFIEGLATRIGGQQAGLGPEVA
ncbi:hypothetical protein D3C84_1003400 [compost metagenome]